MSIKKSLIKNTGFNLGSYVVLLVSSFFSISVLLNNLGRETFGIYIFLTSVIPLASVFDFGISSAVVRRLSLPGASTGDRIKTWKTSFSLFIIMAAIVSLVISAVLLYLTHSLPLFQNIDQSALNIITLIIGLTVFVNHINSHFLSLPQAEQRFDIFNSKSLIVGSANTVFSALLSSYFPSIAPILFLQLVFHLLTFVYLVFYAQKIFHGKDFLPDYEKSESRELLSFGLKNFVGTLASQIEAQFSKYVLGIMVSAEAVTAYSIPQNIVAKGAAVVSQIAQVIFPLGTSLLVKERIRKLGKTVLAIQLLTFLGGILAVILSFTIGEQFLLWWLKDQIVVYSALPILKILSFYFVLTSLTPIPSVLLQSLNKPQIPSFFAVLTVVTEIIAILILVPKYHVVGVAYGVLIASIVTVPPFLIVTAREYNREVKKLENR
ncbi:MAG TPA: oligosaccharide flippase family protein [Candidatus Woesebacteria bacterium]|nr:oligosaccharide flippase family protein [Candidatus Woesebacteria bacterium]